MGRRRREGPRLVVDELPADVRAVIETALNGDEVAVVRDEQEIGTLSFTSSVLDGVVLPASRQSDPDISSSDGVTVVATAMRLSEAAHRRLSDEFGSDYLVLDLHDAPVSTNVLLTNPVSPQLLGLLSAQFPRARIIITEIEDEELGVSYTGPVSRLLGAGAAAYLSARPLGAVAAGVHTYLTQDRSPAIEAVPSARRQLPPAPDQAHA